ncbi:3-hydroxyacyl-CoA dehydrogenase family protein [Halobaculum sp. CBA1158]|uniref:3-hydroxyacyl-CoA dehydrogenase family protein n=1 Tax=Halobaculum sp. CBA1158 TaxID=2904243 RepID=UPI001F2361CF|nr:3-hydroxyacyl-CoA dehydrogenase family protein [Halobaculum sp. CBA1158]UIO99157.1 3-hydroxyacyl-CoA dehydrogenase family protein [Halobaculum sp. CBA1158]
MRVTVLGAGTMGAGIARSAAAAGHEVALRDIEESRVADGLADIEATLEEGVARGAVTEAERTAALDRITGTTSLSEAAGGAALVIEAVPEDADLKRDVLGAAESHVAADAVLASNTSALSVTGLASALERPERLLGLHFFNPVHVMELVEVVVAERTSEATLATAREFVDSLGKTAVEVRDSPGFASSRLGVALGAEAIRMYETGVAGVADIDAAMELGYDHPMGPLELTDLIGLDVRLDVLEHLREELGERFRPPQALKRKVRAGKLGKKTGEGFYVWEDGEAVRPADEPSPAADETPGSDDETPRTNDETPGSADGAGGGR